MKSNTSLPRNQWIRQILLIVLSLGFLTGCATNKARYVKAVVETEKANSNLAALETAKAEKKAIRKRAIKALTLPARCSQTERSGLKLGERLSASLLKTDAALTRANKKILACSAHNEQAKKGFREN